LDSQSEVKVYDFISKDLKIDSIKFIGSLRKSQYVFVFPKENKDKKYCPDFVIDNINNKTLVNLLLLNILDLVAKNVFQKKLHLIQY